MVSRSCHAHPYLLVVSPDQAEDEAAVHQGQKITEEEGQAGVEALGQLRILWTQGLSAHIHCPHQASVPALGLALTKATSDLQEPRHSPKALGLFDTPLSLDSQPSWLSFSLRLTLPFPTIMSIPTGSAEDTFFSSFTRYEQHGWHTLAADSPFTLSQSMEALLQSAELGGDYISQAPLQLRVGMCLSPGQWALKRACPIPRPGNAFQRKGGSLRFFLTPAGLLAYNSWSYGRCWGKRHLKEKKPH